MKIATLVVCAGLLAGFGAGARYGQAQASQTGRTTPPAAGAAAGTSATSPADTASKASSPPAAGPATGLASAAPSGAAAKVGSDVISQEDLEKIVAVRLLTLRTEEYEIRRAALQDLVGEKLLRAEASRRGVSFEDLVKTEIEAKTPVPPEAQISSILEANRNRLGSMSEAEARKSIADQLSRRAKDTRRDALVKELSAKTPVQILLSPPRLSNTSDPGAPIRGPKDAIVTIVEFSDFQCPFCSRSNVTMKQVMERYPTQVRWVFRDFPLPIHNDAEKAAVAARCAAEQGKFWEMHDVLFQNQSDLSVGALARYGTQIGLDASRYTSCQSVAKHMDAIQADLKAGTEFGVTGTPAFFINGRFVNGARPIDSFSEIIDEELQLAGVKPPPAADR
jgi:protein-disulfide isomerase